MISYNIFGTTLIMDITGKTKSEIEIGPDPIGNITRINNALEGLPKRLLEKQEQLINVERQLENAKIEVGKPFEKENELIEKLNRLAELNAMLNMDVKDTDAVMLDEDMPDDDVEMEDISEEKAETAEKSEIIQYSDRSKDRLSFREKLKNMNTEINSVEKS